MLRTMMKILRYNGTNTGAFKLRSKTQKLECLAAMHERVGWSQKSACFWTNEHSGTHFEGLKYSNIGKVHKRMVFIGSQRPVIRPSCPGSQAVHVSSMKLVVASVGTGPDTGGESSEMYEEEDIYLPERCPGCGVKLQLDDPDAPG